MVIHIGPNMFKSKLRSLERSWAMSSDLLRDQWASLGVAFNVKTDIVSDPESALFSFLESGEFPEDRKMIGLILAWLKEYSNLVHIERLKNLIKPLGSLELAILGGIAAKCIKFGDYRWKTIINYIKERNTGRIRFDIGDSAFLINKNGEDQEFKEFGLSLWQIDEDKSEKIVELKLMLEGNRWIRYRTLFGVNMRADVATVMVLKLAGSAYQTAKFLNCSFNSASRNWNDLRSVDFNG